MKINNKLIGSRMTRAALLLGALLCAQNVKACWISVPVICTDWSINGDCSEDEPYVDEYSIGASYHNVCSDVGPFYFQTSATCSDAGTSYPCTYTLHVDNCDGSSSDTPDQPVTPGVSQAVLGGSCL